jgi:hypothetical protein
MTITEIREAFQKEGFTFTDEEVEQKLTAAKMSADEVDGEMMAVWLEAMQQQQNKPAPKGKGKTAGLAKSESAPPATQPPTQPPAPTQQEIPVDVPFANLDQVLGGIENVGVQIVLQTNDHINHVVEKVVNFAQAGPTLTAQRINQRMGLVALENPVESILQANRDLCLNSLSRIDEAIARAS